MNKNPIIFYFIITYFITILLTRPSPIVEQNRVIFWIIPLLIWFFAKAINIISKNVYFRFWLSQSLNINYYFLFLSIVMVITNLVSINVIYSIFSSLFSVFLLAVMFNVIGAYLLQMDSNIKYRNIITNQLLLILFIAFIGELFIPSWDWDSTIRMSGGVNPNMMALIALFTIIWFIDLRIDKVNLLKSNIGILLGILLLFGSLSRGRIIAFITLIFYIFACYFMLLLHPKIQYRINKNRALLFGILSIISIIIFIIILPFVLQQSDLVARLTTSIDARENAWIILSNGFKENILLGSYGWWNSTDVIMSYTYYYENIATSSHNLYLRLLSEVGLVGAVSILIFPIYLIIKSLQKIFLTKNLDKNNRKKLVLYSGATLAFFISQFVEDQYLNGIGDFQTGLFAWILTLNYFYLIKPSLGEITNNN